MNTVHTQMDFRTWLLFFVGDPFTPERVLEKLRSLEDPDQARMIWKKLKRDRMLGEDFKGLKLDLLKKKGSGKKG
ncbi:hypothetical protein LEP1GSC115_4873 [Leptospira interrogans serovar Australis str. 200703203]|uniref:Uncharacterized protein n=1 Tax=Leptospira interrogans serovar Australis str. 200703203 TaxID=1085541 RepID=N1UDZ6_LEPIR|nr:hypothetical protein LEP1GSC115_4873 [Leptospira interrogans serovar Australis str. 200703203]